MRIVMVVALLVAGCVSTGVGAVDRVRAQREATNQIERVRAYELNLEEHGVDVGRYRTIRLQAEAIARREPAEAQRMCEEVQPEMLEKLREVMNR